MHFLSQKELESLKLSPKLELQNKYFSKLINQKKKKALFIHSVAKE